MAQMPTASNQNHSEQPTPKIPTNEIELSRDDREFSLRLNILVIFICFSCSLAALIYVGYKNYLRNKGIFIGI